MLLHLDLHTPSRSAMIDITTDVQKAVSQSGVSDGLCIVFVPHTTAGITINENADPDVPSDILNTLNKLIPRNAGYQHSEGNADSHVKASLMGSSVTVPIESGRLLLGTWQGIFFCEFDGPRHRKVILKIAK